MQGFDRQRDALTAADAKRDKAARETVAAHRVDQLGGQHRTGGADRMAMGHGAAFDVDDVLGQPELARDNDGDGGEGFIDLGALDERISQPARCKACLTAGTGPNPNMPGSTAAMP